MQHFRQVFFLFTLTFISCTSRTKESNISDKAQPNINNIFFSPDNFYADTLYIKTQFMECGEWGGHIELSKIYLKEKEFYMSFQEFTADCNSIGANNGRPKQILIKTLNKKLNNKDKQLIRQYCHNLLDEKFSQLPAMMNAGYIFEIKNLNGSFNLFVYTWGTKTRDEYLLFINRLFE